MSPNVKIKLDGFTDTYGTRAVNDRISYLRAYNLHNLLVSKGVRMENITMVAHGESKPIGRCAYEYPCPIEDRQKNRRVEVRLTPRYMEGK
jgi:OOP family OmpA-OmpF porin